MSSAAGRPPPAEWVAAEFGLGSVSGEPAWAARGEMGHVWRLATAGGVWAVKSLLDHADSGGGDAPFQLALHAAGVPLPRPVLTGTGGAVAAGPDGRAYRVYEWLDLDPTRRIDPETVGGLLARVHRVAWPADDVDPWFRRPVPDDRWPALLAAARAAGAPWHDLLAARVDDIVATTATVGAAPPAGIVRCHLDFNDENVLADRDGRPWVIDWENSGGHAPQQELMQVLYAFAGDDAGAAGAILAGYRAEGGEVGRPDLGSFTLTFAVQANVLAFYVERALTGAEADRARAVWRLETMLPDLLTVERARRLLDVCAAGV